MRTQMWINGQFTAAASGRTFDVLDPATEEVIERVPAGGAADVDAAVSAASAAFPAWRSLGAGERAEMLHEVARKLTEQTEALAELLTREGGKPLVENRDEMGWSAACFRYYAEIGRNTRGRVIPSGESSQLNLVLKEPYGVVGAIVPWNYPILLMAWKVAPALAAGNTVVIKPSEMTPLSTLAFADIFDHLPPGVVNIVSGYGREAGEPLVLDPRVRVIAFTGSLETGPPDRAPRVRSDEEAAPRAGRQRRLHRRRGRRPRHRRAGCGLGGAAQHRPGLHLHRARLRPRASRAGVHRAHRRVCARAAAGQRAGAADGCRPDDRRHVSRQGGGACRPTRRRVARASWPVGGVLPRVRAATSTSRRCW